MTKEVKDLPPLPLSDDEILAAIREHHRLCVTNWNDIHRVIVSPDGTISHWCAAPGLWGSVCADCRYDPCRCGGVPYDCLLIQSDGCHANDWNEAFVPVSWRDDDFNHVSQSECSDDREGEWYYGLPNDTGTVDFDDVADSYVDDHMETVDLEEIKKHMCNCFFGSDDESEEE